MPKEASFSPAEQVGFNHATTRNNSQVGSLNPSPLVRKCMTTPSERALQGLGFGGGLGSVTSVETTVLGQRFGV